MKVEEDEAALAACPPAVSVLEEETNDGRGMDGTELLGDGTCNGGGSGCGSEVNETLCIVLPLPPTNGSVPVLCCCSPLAAVLSVIENDEVVSTNSETAAVPFVSVSVTFFICCEIRI